MKVRRLYHPRAMYVTSADSLRDVARKMRASRLSCLAVLDGSHIAGIITERDLVEAMAKGVSAADSRAMDYTNDGSVTVSLDDESDIAQLKMLAIGCRHLPVVDHGELVGMISARDLLLTQPRLEVESRMPALAGLSDRTSGGWPDEPPPDVDSER